MEPVQLVTISLVGLTIVAGGLLLLVFGLTAGGTAEETVRLRNYVSEAIEVEHSSPAQTMAFRRGELSGSFRARLILPWLKRLGRLLGQLTPARLIDDLRRQLTMAGNPLGLGPREFYGLRLMSALLGLGAAFWLLRGQSGLTAASLRSSSTLMTLGGVGIVVYMGLFLPKRWLRQRITRRQTQVRKSLPDALDMLTVCADAGLGFDQAMQRVSERWKTPLGLEFARTVGEMQMGVSRQVAMRNLADRLDVTELTSFVAVIVQSDQLGMSIVQTLRAQAEQMRVERRFRAQEIARTLPIKMLIPLAFFIFPAIIAVVLGPAIPPLMELFGNF